MADDERLREALLELQLLRKREAQSLDETRTLLECLEAYSSATTPGEALSSIFISLRNTIGADVSLLGKIEGDGAFTVLGSDGPLLASQSIVPPFDLAARSRNIVDLKTLGTWQGAFDATRFNALQCVPVLADGDTYALLVFKAGLQSSETGSLRLVERLAGLALRALQGSKIASENKLLAAAIHGSSSGFAIADATKEERPLIYVNEAFEQISGYDASEVLGINCRFLSAEADESEERLRVRSAVSANAPGQFLLRNRKKDGTLFWNELTLFPVENEAGQVVSLVATQNDVTTRVEAAGERDRTRAQMARALTATEDAYLVLEEGQLVAFANDATRDVFPTPGHDWAPGTTFSENWHAYIVGAMDLPGRVTALLAQPDLHGLCDLPSGREIDLPDGRTVLVRASAMQDGGMVMSATDVTPMKAAQRLLAQRLAAIEAAEDGIAITDDTGRLTYLNGAASAMLGFRSPAKGLGKMWYVQYAGTERRDRQRAFTETLERVEEGRTKTHDVTATELESGGFVLQFRDITDRLAYETREAELKAGLQQLQRQEATAQLTAGIAHDFNNLLSAINGSATLIGLEEDLTDGLKPHVDRIATAGNQAARLVNRLLDVWTHNDEQGVFDLGSALSDIPSLVEPSLPDNVALEMASMGEAIALKGNPGELAQVIVNLVLNARDAIGENDGQIAVSTEHAISRSKERASVGELLSSQAYVRIDVTDTGVGIPADSLETVFEPYFSTKGHKGTGLGLAMVSLQVQGVGGAVGIASTEGHGTTISVYWPIADLESRDDPGSQSGAHDLSGQTIIVVDDDADVATVAAKYLEAQGAEVAVSIDPRDAIEAVEEDPEAWSAVITDYDMPEMTGGDLAEWVKRIRPDIPVILVTALARRLTDPRINDGNIDAVLPKPTNLNHLSSLLSDYHRERTKG
ncbi:MAG: PAS domain-containing protein [Pseudomonadota bacterium]